MSKDKSVTKGGLPLNNPIASKTNLPRLESMSEVVGRREKGGLEEKTPKTCQFCDWSTTSIAAMDYHLNQFHEQELADASRTQTQSETDRQEHNRQFLLSHGYRDCPVKKIMCPGKISPIMRKLCHNIECP